ncbi:MAG: 50S ribosomal protein L24 [Candidatus Micrarchaeota archaeon]
MKFNSSVSSLPRKKRKAAYDAALHDRRKKMHMHVSKELRKTLKKRAALAKKGDKVRVVRGDFRKREAKITAVDLYAGRIFLEGVIAKRQGGKEMPAPIEPSNCILTDWKEPILKAKKAKPEARKEEKKG